MQIPAPADSLAATPALLRIPVWSAYDWLLHGFSTRLGGCSTVYAAAQNMEGELNLGFTASDTRENVLRNRRAFVEAAAQEKKLPELVTLRQIHSAVVRTVRHEEAAGESDGAACGEADGMMTAEPGLLLAIQTADCIPVLVADTKRRVVAAFHAGWRGTVKHIAESGVGRMREEFGSDPKDLVAAIGPGIGACCYAVGEEVIDAFGTQFGYASALFREPSPSAVHLDLIEANRRQLLDAGISASAVSVTGECTRCHPERYFSYRGSNGFTGRMFSAIGVAE